MNPKITKVRTRMQRNTERIAALQEENKELQKELTALENLEIVGMVREIGMTPDQLTALLSGIRPDSAAKEAATSVEKPE